MSFKASLSPLRMRATSRPVLARATATLTIEAKQNSLRRQRTSEKARLRNKARKSEAKTRIKKVLKAVEMAEAEPPVQSETQLSGLTRLMSEAYKAVDKAVSKGALHRNAGARRKSRVALARQRLLIAAGLYTPPSVLEGEENCAVEAEVESVTGGGGAVLPADGQDASTEPDVPEEDTTTAL